MNMEKPHAPFFPMDVESAESQEIQLFDIGEKGTEGMLRAYENIGRDKLPDFADAISKNARHRLESDFDFLNPTQVRRLEGYVLLPYTLESALALSDEYSQKTSLIEEKVFVAASVEALGPLREKVSDEGMPDEDIPPLASKLVAEFAEGELELKYSKGSKKPASPSKAKENATGQDIDMKSLMSSEPVAMQTYESSGVSNRSSVYRPEYMPPKSTVEKFDRQYLEPLARRIKAGEQHLDDFLAKIDDEEDKEHLLTVVKTAFGPISRDEAAQLFERSDRYVHMLDFIKCGGDEALVKNRMGRAMSADGYKEHVHQINLAWRKIPTIAARAGYI